MWPGQPERTSNSHVGRQESWLQQWLGERHIHKPLIGGGGSAHYIDLSDINLRAMLDQGDPTGNYYQYALPLEASSDRTGVDVYYAQSMIFSIPNGVQGSRILGFSALIGALNLTGHPNGPTSPSPSFTSQVRFYSDEIDPTTIVWNDRAGLTLLGTAFTFINNIITSSTQTGVDTDIDLTLGGDAGATFGVFAEPSVVLNTSIFRAVEVVLDSPGVTDPTTGESSYAADISSPRLYLGDDA